MTEIRLAPRGFVSFQDLSISANEKTGRLVIRPGRNANTTSPLSSISNTISAVPGNRRDRAARLARKYLCNAPDIMDFENRIIIEYEEESRPGKRMGKIGKKGHWADSKRDTQRDTNYRRAGFRVCKIWESEMKKGPWNLKLFHFLADCYCKRPCKMYADMFLKEKDLKQAMMRRN